ncbi:hypothetical protein HMPREF3039_00464 [Akkermansia sp. KLE1798]|nr:hypothetical protein HMPREF3039_00464 [Akkermansia sp. KLE1798]KZA05865.1 hypothetical protein HMPREF1326_00445 [Akkermansia sp. KLE1605]
MTLHHKLSNLLLHNHLKWNVPTYHSFIPEKGSPSRTRFLRPGWAAVSWHL